ncbi:MAG TPA: methyl-accepting chemotaxis protein [Mobilitalea sp.]|nr:methyl-accepting chemotaxis protein [Mobilitalea sp.]
MRWFYNMKIGAKLILSFIIVAIIAGVVGGIGIYNISIINRDDAKLYNNMTVPLSYTSELAKLFQQVRVNTRDMALEKDASEINSKYQEIQDLVTQMNDVCDKFNATILSAEIQTAYDEFLATRSDFRSSLDELLQLCLENKDTQAYALIKGDMKTASDNEQAAIDKLVQLKLDAAKATSDSNKLVSRNAIVLMATVIVIGMLIAILLGIAISRIIGKPIRKVATAAELIADGDLNIYLDINTKDEVGILAASFRKMADNLNDVMSNISIASEQVASGSRQVSDSSMALSQGATEQASSVEELSSSLEEISVQTKQNADNANKANLLAEAAKENADTGNSQMKDMLKAMDEINDSSNNISKIIKVIDDIAFQTNILALNAAVEAARAGQHGKGFAVVAEEVRNLAARSAKAAKETTDMIEGSIKKVDGGTKIANQTADALVQIVDNITKVADLVGDIANASTEQAAAISQVNQGVLQVSSVVQMNSATSEESAAASEELSSQAELLKNQVLRFKLRKQSRDNFSYKGAEPVYDMSKGYKTPANANGSVNSTYNPGKSSEGSKKIILDDQEFGKY